MGKLKKTAKTIATKLKKKVVKAHAKAHKTFGTLGKMQAKLNKLVSKGKEANTKFKLHKAHLVKKLKFHKKLVKAHVKLAKKVRAKIKAHHAVLKKIAKKAHAAIKKLKFHKKLVKAHVKLAKKI